MGKYITEYLLYAKRYLIGYTLIGVAIVGLLLLASFFIPGGLSQMEMNAVVTSDALSLTPFDPASVINLPYHLLQRASIELFGVSQMSIKLPSLLLGAFSAWGMIILLRTWFRHNVAIIATALTVTTGQFLFIAQSGAPGIVYVFLSVWLLVAAMMISNRAKFSTLWKIFLFIIAALSLYTPLSAYILVALVSAMMLHPHLRYIVRRLSKLKLALGSVIALVLLVPLGYAIIQEPSVGLTLLGIPTQWPDLLGNFTQLLKQYFDFISPISSTLMTPVYGLGSLILIILGILDLFTTKYTARSYVIAAWVILLSPILIINPRFTSVTFVPALLLMAMGIHKLLRSWYQLFPRNPYARIAGLLPLAVLIGGMVVSGIGRYTYGYLYDPQIASNFSKDLRLVNRELHNSKQGKTTILASDEQLAFYSVIAKHHKNVVATSSLEIPASETTIVTHDAAKTAELGEPSKIVTDARTQDSDRFYIYKTDKK